MSEKRFEFKLKVNFIDEETGEEIYHKVLIDNSNGNEIGFDDMVGLLNEQQATIRKLQDLCGESDGENAKLRIENKELQEEIKLLKPTNVEQYEQIVQLQKENEQLQAKLREKEEDEQLYANEIVKLNKEAKEVLDFKSLGGDY